MFFLEFKQSTDREEGFLKVKEAAAKEQHSSIIEVFRAVADGWAVEHVNFVVGNRGSVMEGDFYEKLEKLDVEAEKKDNIFSDHVTQICEAHDRVILSYLQQIHGSPGQMREDQEPTLGKMCMCRKQETRTWSSAEGTSNESGISIVKLRATIKSARQSPEDGHGGQRQNGGHQDTCAHAGARAGASSPRS